MANKLQVYLILGPFHLAIFLDQAHFFWLFLLTQNNAAGFSSSKTLRKEPIASAHNE